VWICHDLVGGGGSKRIRLEDCFPMSRNQRINATLVNLSFSCNIWASESRPTFLEVLKRIPKAEGVAGFGK
jgi:hypothetical protein